MAFVEAADKAPRLRKLQVFATDLNEALLDMARHGLYAKSIAQDLSPERLRRFFVEEQGGYRIAKPLREMVVFARQNVISDPPFSRIDLISCRNLLIYLEPILQRKAASRLPLRPQAGRVSLPGRLRIHRRLHRPVRAGGQEAQDLQQEVAPAGRCQPTGRARARAERPPRGPAPRAGLRSSGGRRDDRRSRPSSPRSARPIGSPSSSSPRPPCS